MATLGSVFAACAYTTLLLVLLNHNRLYYANGIEIDEPQLQLELQQQQQQPDGNIAFRDTSVISDSDNLISFSNQSTSSSVNGGLINFHSKQTKHDRVRRNSILLGSQSQNNGGLLGNNFSPVPQQTAAAPAQQNLEGLLASCQLTNLLLYQLVNNQQQQKAAIAPGLLAAPSSPFLSPFNPFLQPAAAGPLLSTYTTTSTYTTKMTSTDVITIPLLFGNKPIPTTVTRTKTYDVTTSTELTLTSTILPTTTTTTIIQVVPSAEAALAPTKASKYGVEPAIEPSLIGGHYETPILNSLNAEEMSTATAASKRSKKKRKNRPSSQQKQGRQLQYQDELEVGHAPVRGSSPAYKYGQREKQELIELKSPSRGNAKFRRQYIYQDDADATQLENPDYYIADYYPSEVIHHNQQRLKRRGEVDSVDAGSSPDEFILEPSFDSSSNVQLAEECPATTTTVTLTVTSTKTVTKTKLVNPATALSGLVRETTDALYNSNNVNYAATNRAKKNFISSRGNSDRRSAGSGNGYGGSGKGRTASSTSTSSTERSGSGSERRKSSYRQRSTTPDTLSLLASTTNNYYNSNLSPNINSNSGINSRRSRSRFHANYYAGRASY